MSFRLSHIIFLLVAVAFISCSKKDTTAPEITLKGSSYAVIALNSHYTDPGATASDNMDGFLKVTVSDTVNSNFAGTYNITYHAIDAAGNEASASRTVVVKNDAEIYNDTYNNRVIIGVDTTNYLAQVTTSNILNKRIWMVGFSNIDNAVVFADISNDTIRIHHQLVSAGIPAKVHAFSGDGLIKIISNHTVFEINFSDSTSGNTFTGTSVYTKTN